MSEILNKAKEFCDQAMMIDHEVMELPDWMAAFHTEIEQNAWTPIAEGLPNPGAKCLWQVSRYQPPMIGYLNREGDRVYREGGANFEWLDAFESTPALAERLYTGQQKGIRMRNAQRKLELIGDSLVKIFVIELINERFPETPYNHYYGGLICILTSNNTLQKIGIRAEQKDPRFNPDIHRISEESLKRHAQAVETLMATLYLSEGMEAAKKCFVDAVDSCVDLEATVVSVGLIITKKGQGRVQDGATLILKPEPRPSHIFVTKPHIYGALPEYKYPIKEIRAEGYLIAGLGVVKTEHCELIPGETNV